jgi:hypothetical protein
VLVFDLKNYHISIVSSTLEFSLAISYFYNFILFCLGGDDLKGKRVASIRGTDLLTVQSFTGTNISSIAGTELESILAPLQSVAVLSIPVFTDYATINFQSRSTADLHFFATYSTSTSCPPAHIFNTAIKQCQFVDVNKNKYSNQLFEY